MEVVPILSVVEVRLHFSLPTYVDLICSKRRDPLHVLLDYIGTVSVAGTIVS